MISVIVPVLYIAPPFAFSPDTKFESKFDVNVVILPV